MVGIRKQVGEDGEKKESGLLPCSRLPQKSWDLEKEASRKVELTKCLVAFTHVRDLDGNPGSWLWFVPNPAFVAFGAMNQ